MSTREQADAGGLERQVLELRQYAEERGLRVTLELTDVSSGLNPRRRGLQKAIAAAGRGKIRFLLIEHPDRLAGVGYEYLLNLFEILGVRVIAISETLPEDARSELARDLLAIATPLSTRLHGAPGGKTVREALQRALAEVRSDGPGG